MALFCSCLSPNTRRDPRTCAGECPKAQTTQVLHYCYYCDCARPAAWLGVCLVEFAAPGGRRDWGRHQDGFLSRQDLRSARRLRGSMGEGVHEWVAFHFECVGGGGHQRGPLGGTHFVMKYICGREMRSILSRARPWGGAASLVFTFSSVQVCVPPSPLRVSGAPGRRHETLLSEDTNLLEEFYRRKYCGG